MEYSKKVISLARIKNIAQRGKNDLEKFLLQQNIIQFELAIIVILRSQLPDKKFIKSIEGKTLGKLIKLYKISTNKNEDDEVMLLALLEKYNKRRKYLVHRIVEDCNWRKTINEAKSANSEGLEIMNLLEKILYKLYKTIKAKKTSGG